MYSCSTSFVREIVFVFAGYAILAGSPHGTVLPVLIEPE